jgi:dTDP-L-rhamnose 4-epimerase
MSRTVLITGGAGFIGRHVARGLLEQGDHVRVLDNLLQQVHPTQTRPAELDPDVELITGDVRDSAAIQRALRDVDSVIHLAAEVGVGQSMYSVERYTSVNELGTAVLFQHLIANPVRRVVVASSMSIYGEGRYRSLDGQDRDDVERPAQGSKSGWDPVDPLGQPMIPVPTPEEKKGALASVYAIGKFMQERLTLTLTRQYGMQGTALRLWNAYGPGQALSNPYTGVLAIFASRIASGRRPMIFEDGQQRRDFVHISDVAQAFLLALDHPQADGQVFNIASGEDRTVEQVARLQAASMGHSGLAPEITGQMRAGDIRHCIPDLTKARTLLGYRPQQEFMDGLAELAEWVARQEVDDRVGEARRELERRGLVA